MKNSIFLVIIYSLLITHALKAQKSGSILISLDYGVDRDISRFYHSVPNLEQYLTLSQVTSKHPRAFTVLYQWGKSNWKYRVGTGILTRSLQQYKLNEGFSGQTNYTQYLGIAGIARTKRINDLMSLTYGVDLIVSYESFYSKIGEGFREITSQGQERIIRTIIYFGGNHGEFVPMFSPNIQSIIQLSKNSKLILGVGFYGQFYKSYFFNVNIAESIPGQHQSNFFRSDLFHMWVPFFRAGIELF